MVGAFELCLVPSGALLITSFLAISMKVSSTVVSGMQHLAAGIVLSAVAVELVPEILNAPSDFSTTCGMTIGFASGIGVLLLLSNFCGDHDDSDSEDDLYQLRSVSQPESPAATPPPTPPPRIILSPDTSVPMSSESAMQSEQTAALATSGFLELAGSAALRKRAYAVKPSKQELMRQDLSTTATPTMGSAPPPFPLALTVAVGTDALIDGLLIGISSASGAQAGVVITGALAIEMGFLGLTFASCLRK